MNLFILSHKIENDTDLILMSTGWEPGSILENKKEHSLQQTDIQQKDILYPRCVFKKPLKNNYVTHAHTI